MTDRPTDTTADTAERNRPAGFSATCSVIGAACLWSWGYLASLSTALFPTQAAVESIGIEFSYYASQLTLLVFSLVGVLVVRRWQPALPPGAVVGSALVLGATGITMRAVLTLPQPPLGAIIACGVIDGLAGMVLTIAWGARFSLGSRGMRRMVLLSFLVGYAIYLGGLLLPHTLLTLVAICLPLLSGALWLVDSWRRHLLTSEVWPVGVELGGRTPGELAAGSTGISILPWRTMGLFAVTALVGNFISSFIMGATYSGAAVMFPGAFAVASAITFIALILVGDGARPLSVERLFRYDLPIAVAGMLIILVMPADPHAAEVAGALVTGASIFLQALVILKVTEVTQETGISPMVSFAVGQGLIGGVVFVGNVAGRAAGEFSGIDPSWLSITCAAGIFTLFYLLIALASSFARQLGAEGIPSRDGFDSADEPAADQGAPIDAAEYADLPHLEGFSARLGLTPREADVLRELLRGRSLPAAAERLFVTAGTVKTHTSHIYRKAGVTNRQELIDLYDGFQD